MGFCIIKQAGKKNNIARRIDIRFVPYDSYYSALLYFTGSAELNRKMRQIAKSMKLKLSDYKCKCNKIYCTSHRYPETHACIYDYKSEGSKILEKNLIKVNGNKIEKI